MHQEKFLSFRGLKQYDPSVGWAQVQKSAASTDVNINDPLLDELFEQLEKPAPDDLTHNWRVIASSVNRLSQRMSEQRELRNKLNEIDQELDGLRHTILHDLQDIQQAADQQLSMARLRAEVSALAQARLASHLKKDQS
ncbi:MAG: hypothetical protein WCO80_10600 [Betaproteobacteria bacterium]